MPNQQTPMASTPTPQAAYEHALLDFENRDGRTTPELTGEEVDEIKQKRRNVKAARAARAEQIATVVSDGTIYAKADGVTHLNIYSNSKTDLGRGLAHFAFSPFLHPYYGPFNSMEGFWHFIRAEEPDHRLRTFSGHRAKLLGKTLKTHRVENFRELVNEANYHRIAQSEKLRALIVDSNLPFDHYYLFGPGQKLVRPMGFEWLVDGFENIRKMLKKGQIPDPVNPVV